MNDGVLHKFTLDKTKQCSSVSINLLLGSFYFVICQYAYVWPYFCYLHFYIFYLFTTLNGRRSQAFVPTYTVFFCQQRTPEYDCVRVHLRQYSVSFNFASLTQRSLTENIWLCPCRDAAIISNCEYEIFALNVCLIYVA